MTELTINKFDTLNRYIFNDHHVRGEMVQLKDTYQSILHGHDYPLSIRVLLGELLAATCLLTATLKFDGEITVQLQGDGPLSYASIGGNNNQEMRGIAKFSQDIPMGDPLNLLELIGKGVMIITIRPFDGEPYQGVVSLEQPTLAQCVEHYFEVSEQIPTKVWLFINTEQQLSAGSLIQLLPDGDGSVANRDKMNNDFDHLCQLTNTIKSNEIFDLEAQALLFRLYHQEKVELYPAQKVSYVCGCSRDKCLTAISQMDGQELNSILEEQGKMSMTCDYCHTTYDFVEVDLLPFISKLRH
jgi:molecular chaperone Hsp33